MLVEWLKLRRSRLVWVTAALLVVGVPAMASGFLSAARFGSPGSPTVLKISTMVVGEGWAAYLGVLGQIMSVAMPLGAGIVTSWCFGREFIDRTVSSLFAMPTSRATVAVAKCAVVTGWACGVGVASVVVGCLLGPVAGIWTPDRLMFDAAGKVLLVSLGSAMLTLPLAFVASVARGYLPAIAVLILIVVLTQIVTVIGVGRWFPYAAVSLWAGMGGEGAAAEIHLRHLALVPVTGLAGVAVTTWWWRRMQVV
ncbi:ABC-2 type transport system permease protein [Microlunatus panaciterrae]|uniref:ABC-2 type transport system permease protein n=1 Tax=Microlunatus panaciterrae TaxID=400768 RepID=A0ABS2RL39_9ACTN|nr:ABC transporter permease [Microlunatus panaciterrae]MBM7799383.1 ABC-2 type transport system permease protein [Microlunatus panaciterrae]